jgi:hypothetical protein
MTFLRNGGTAIDAVEVAIRVLEDREATNAGYGSNLCIDGTVECDATIVDHFGRSGAVAAIGREFLYFPPPLSLDFCSSKPRGPKSHPCRPIAARSKHKATVAWSSATKSFSGAGGFRFRFRVWSSPLATQLPGFSVSPPALSKMEERPRSSATVRGRG